MLGLAFAAALTAAAPDRNARALFQTASLARGEVRASRRTAAALARTVAPAEIMVPMQLELAHQGIVNMPSLDPAARQLEADYPGLWSFVWAMTESHARRSIEGGYPDFLSALERLYRATLSEREAQAVLAFYRSPTGQKLILGMTGGFDPKPMFQDIVANPANAITAEQMAAVTDAARKKALAQLGPEDQPRLAMVVQAVGLEKFRALGANTRKLTLEWARKENSDGDAGLQAIIEAAMHDYMAAHPRP
jgi:hypothetical protein